MLTETTIKTLLPACVIVASYMWVTPPTYAQDVTASVQSSHGHFTLLRDGKPYFIKGAGGSASLPELKAAGGNSIRTWGADNLGPILDQAQKLGLTVCVGIWFGHREHGFRYDDPDQVAKQQEMVRQTVLKYKDHPAVLIWALGNEMEIGQPKKVEPLMWQAIEDAAKLVKQLDPHHPTMTVIAEIGGGGEKVKQIDALCPDIDIIGVNSYGGAASLPARYKAAGGTKPYVITEFGPAGTWEVGRNAWGAAPELSSTAKGEVYKKVYETAVKNQPNCLGSYAFTWGAKQEATATWFGMFLPDGSKLAAVDAMTEEWSGRPAATLCPKISSLKIDGSDQNPPGATIHASLGAADPQNLPLNVRWVLQKDPMADSVGGQTQAKPPVYPEAILPGSDATHADIHLPDAAGAYRLFAYVYDGKGGAAVANVPLLATTGAASSAEKPGHAANGLRKAVLPLTLAGTPNADTTFAPAGWMGNAGAIKMDAASTENPHSGRACLKFTYGASDNWGGVVWQSPANDWGDKPGGLNFSDAKTLSFWARGAQGGEQVTFKFGLLGADKKYSDTASGATPLLTLTPEWKRYTISLSGKDLSRIKTPFCWIVAGQGKPVTFYLDDVRYE